ncbi:hypothetical protein DPEC_G00347470 [Dallia pectoralis]|uniref:Uncharacterized protein n=1 Tax=Dallia pectoralis TaxID=75939 RepID=A0ACC2F4A9_DALPE|nr:hypothetical protein DPEC_G00347470 [Dallia pectoralis]
MLITQIPELDKSRGTTRRMMAVGPPCLYHGAHRENELGRLRPPCWELRNDTVIGQYAQAGIPLQRHTTNASVFPDPPSPQGPPTLPLRQHPLLSDALLVKPLAAHIDSEGTFKKVKSAWEVKSSPPPPYSGGGSWVDPSESLVWGQCAEEKERLNAVVLLNIYLLQIERLLSHTPHRISLTAAKLSLRARAQSLSTRLLIFTP